MCWMFLQPGELPKSVVQPASEGDDGGVVGTGTRGNGVRGHGADQWVTPWYYSGVPYRGSYSGLQWGLQWHEIFIKFIENHEISRKS